MSGVVLKAAVAGALVFLATVIASRDESLAGIIITAPIVTFTTFLVASSNGVDLNELSTETLKALIATFVFVGTVAISSKYVPPLPSLLLALFVWAVLAAVIYVYW